MRLSLIVRRHRWWLGGVLAAVVAAGILSWALWPPPGQAQARQYLDASACLLTGPDGITPGTAAAPVWADMQSASLATRVMVSYLPETKATDAGPMLNSLAERGCGVIIAAGGLATEVARDGRAHPHQRFLLISAAGPAAPTADANTVVVPAAGASGPIEQTIRALAAQAQPLGS